MSNAGGLSPGAAGLHLVGGVPLLRPGEQVFEAMLDGWRNQQLARRLAFSTVAGREKLVRAFASHADVLQWEWTPQLVDEWMTDLRAVRGLRRSTLRGYQIALSQFCRYITDPAYGWPEACEARVRHVPGPGRPRVERRGARPGRRGRPVPAGVHPGRAAGVVRLCRRPGRHHPGRRAQGVARGVPRRGGPQVPGLAGQPRPAGVHTARQPADPGPAPFAAMLTELAANRVNMNTATNPGCPWLFPGQRSGQPLTPGALRQQLQALGIPTTQARTSAFRQLVLQAPAPVVARALGYGYGTATAHAIAGGGAWSRYPTVRAVEGR